MRAYVKIVKITLVVIALIILIFFPTMIKWLFADIEFLLIVENEVIATEISPDGKYAAVVFSRDAGATTGNNYQLSIIKSGENLPEDGGNICITYSEIAAEWLDNKTLQISILENGTIFKQEETLGEVNILYNYPI